MSMEDQERSDGYTLYHSNLWEWKWGSSNINDAGTVDYYPGQPGMNDEPVIGFFMLDAFSLFKMSLKTEEFLGRTVFG